MNKGTAAEAAALIADLLPRLGEAESGVEVVVCPPYTALAAAQTALGNGTAAVMLGAQDLFWKVTGAYTGQISAPMLHDLGVRYVIVGHSESRGRFGVPEPDFTPDVLLHFGETDETVNRKTRAALGAGLTPIVCVGETLAEREAGDTDPIVAAQVRGALVDVEGTAVASLVFAYEPVWAIGTGKTCSADEADRVCGVVRATIGALYTEAVADAVRIQYGGSMKPDNAGDLLSRPHIDGGLIGGASLKAADFAAVVQAAASATGAWNAAAAD
jgi:triosephosphate isomerase